MTRVKTRPMCDCYKPVNNGKSFMLIESLKENNGGLNEFWSYLWKFCHWCGAPAEEVDKMGDIKCPECNSTNYTIVYDDITRVATESCLNCGLNRVVHDPRGQSTGKEGK